jgi:hypothetical protein
MAAIISEQNNHENPIEILLNNKPDYSLRPVVQLVSISAIFADL